MKTANLVRHCTLCTILFALMACPVMADVVVLEPIRDTTIIEDPARDLTNGGGMYGFAGWTGQAAGSAIRRMLLDFDIAGNIPAGAVINSASLQLTVDRGAGGGTVTVTAHRALADWGEQPTVGFRGEAAGTDALPGDVTWNHTFFPGTFWTTPGGDFTPGSSASTTFGTSGSSSFSSTQFTTDVQSMLDNDSANHGWVLVGPESGSRSARRFGSRENPNPSSRPQLTIDYSIPAPASGVSPLSLAALAVLLLGTGAWVLRRATR